MRVLFTTTPGWGHFHPMVPLAKGFLERGHDVAWAATEGVCVRLRAEGFRAMPSGLAEGDGFVEFERRFPEVRSLPPFERPDFMFPRLFGTIHAPRMLADLLPIARAWQPSVVVSEQAEFAGPIAAAAIGVPNLTHSFGSLLPPERIAAAGEEVSALWEGQGLEPRPFAGTYDHLYLDIYPPSLQELEAAHIAAVRPLRPVAFAAGGDEGAPGWLRDGAAPVVYVTFGTIFNRNLALIGTVVTAVRELPVRVLVTLGPGSDPNALGAQPEHVHVAGYIAQTELLEHCAAVVSHAGSGTFLAALAHGLPQLFLPQAADQFRNAAAGVRSGAGIAIDPGELTAQTVRDAVERLIADPSFRDSAARLRNEIRAMPSPGAVVEQVELRFAPDGPAA